MKKRYLLPLLLLLMMVPASCCAQALPELFGAAKDSLTEGLSQGAAMAYAAMDQELTLELSAPSGRIEEGKTLTLSIAAGNPRPVETKVVFRLKLPERLQAAQDTTWEAVLPAAERDEETGALAPSVTVLTREIALMPGGASEDVALEAEMSMGTRFYRAMLPLALCVPDVSVSAQAQGTQGGRLFAGDVFAYEIRVANGGTAPKDVLLELALPESVSLTDALPAGFALENGIVRGHVRAEAAMQTEAGMKDSEAVIRFPLKVAEDTLEGDHDANRTLSGALQADGRRVPLPRVQVCGAKISARLISDTDSLKTGETAKLRMVVVNSGLAPAGVSLSCVLPEGLRLAEEEEEREATPAEMAHSLPPDEGGAAAPAAVKSEPTQQAMSRVDGALVFDVKMDAARETADGIEAATKVIELSVVADEAQEKISERLVGASLAWTVDEGGVQLGEAVAMRVYRPGFLGVSPEDWNGIFWAGLLLMVTISLLYAAVRSDSREEDFCCE
ncbi:MAG: hypothetical protein IJD60_08065 [Clostridia bacterium]|nr:hypothetical protein [Clostridia bacterium]